MKALKEMNLVKKGWGMESWLYNENLCVKIMLVKKDKQCSLHFHKNKEEIFYILNGKIILETIDTNTGKVTKDTFSKDDFILIKQLVPHRFTAIDGDANIIEFSSQHKDSDSYRVAPGDSQNE